MTDERLPPLARPISSSSPNLAEAGGVGEVDDYGRLTVGPTRHPLPGDTRLGSCWCRAAWSPATTSRSSSPTKAGPRRRPTGRDAPLRLHQRHPRSNSDATDPLDALRLGAIWQPEADTSSDLPPRSPPPKTTKTCRRCLLLSGVPVRAGGFCVPP